LSKTNAGPRLGNWIFLQFVLLLVVIVAPLFALVLLTTESGFRGYVYQGDVTKAMAFAPLLEKEFGRVGSWEGVQPLLAQAPFSYHSMPMMGRMGTSIHSDDPTQDFDWIQERVVILDTARRVVVDSKHLLEGTTHPAEHLAEAVILRNPEKWAIGYLLVGTMVDPALTQNHEDFLGKMATTLVILFAVSLVLSVLLAYWLGDRVARPLRTLVLGTRRAASGDWHWKLDPGAPREVRELHDAFQSLGKHLQAAEARKAQLLADAAHELRTPLTVIRGTLEAMIDGIFSLEPESLKALYEEATRMGKIVDSLRLLEDLHGTPFQAVEIEWAPLLRRVVGLFGAQARERNQQLELKCPEDARGRVEPEAITQILVNLVSNGLRHAPDRGLVRVELSPQSPFTVLSVEDSGPGIPIEDRARVFDRFVRLDPSRSGKTGGRGLGLAIVKELVQRHGGTVQIVDGLLGGTRFEVQLPE
jgi:signal transduction histidine kinase